jgi:hypothetical protein
VACQSPLIAFRASASRGRYDLAVGSRRFALLLAGFCALGALGSCSPALRGPDPSTPPLDLTLPRLDGGQFDLAQLRGRVVMVTFFATYSLQTDYELDQVTRVQQAFDGADEQGRVVAVAVGIDTPMVPMYVQAAGLQIPVALLTDDVRDGSTALGPIRQIPRTILIDGDGHLRDDRIGRVEAGVLAKEVSAILDEQ